MDIERFDQVLVLYAYEDLGTDLEEIIQVLREQTKASCLLIKDRWRRDRSDESRAGWCAWGSLPTDPIVVQEGVLRFYVEPSRSFNSGLFLDARPIRNWLSTEPKLGRVLNLFSYTGSLGVAALAGSAEDVLHVDSQNGLVSRISENHRINNLAFDERMVRTSDCYRFLKRMRAKGAKWDTIILDPPPKVAPKGKSPHRRGKGQDYGTLLALLRTLIAPSGRLITFLNRRDRTRAEHEGLLSEAFEGRRHAITWRSESGEDFPENNPDHKLRITVVEIESETSSAGK